MNLFSIDLHILVRRFDNPLRFHRVVSLDQFPFPTRFGLQQFLDPPVTTDHFLERRSGDGFHLVRLDENLFTADFDPLETLDFNPPARS